MLSLLLRITGSRKNSCWFAWTWDRHWAWLSSVSFLLFCRQHGVTRRRRPGEASPGRSHICAVQEWPELSEWTECRRTLGDNAGQQQYLPGQHQWNHLQSSKLKWKHIFWCNCMKRRDSVWTVEKIIFVFRQCESAKHWKKKPPLLVERTWNRICGLSWHEAEKRPSISLNLPCSFVTFRERTSNKHPPRNLASVELDPRRSHQRGRMESEPSVLKLNLQLRNLRVKEATGAEAWRVMMRAATEGTTKAPCRTMRKKTRLR